MQIASCPICENTQNTILYFKEEDLYTGRFSFNVLRCNNCTHLFSFPFPPEKILRASYENANEVFRKDLKRTNKKIEKWNNPWRRFILKEYLGYKNGSSKNIIRCLFAKFLARFTSISPLPFHNGGKVLDVGCNNGLYLHLLKSLGWEVQGIDIDRNACNLAKELGIDVFCGNLEDANFPESFFDVVRFNQVLEHLPDPKKALEEAKRILKKDGKIYISVPNSRSMARFLFKDIWLTTGHIQGFSPRPIEYLCKDLGLKIKSMRFNSNTKLLLKGMDYFFSTNGAFLKNKFMRYIIVSPLGFLLNLLHLSDTFTVEVER